MTESETCYSEDCCPSPSELINVIQPFLGQLHFPFIPIPPVKEDVYATSFAPSTHPGLLTRRIVSIIKGKNGNYTKEECLKYSLMLFERTWDLVHSGTLLNSKGIYCLGGREKIIDTEVFRNPDCHEVFIDSKAGPGRTETVKGVEICTRPVMIPETHDILFDNVYLTSFMDRWSNYLRSRSEL
jgi:hypothetical protein